MNMPPKFDPLALEITKNAIPFVADNAAESEDDADSELDFSIADVADSDALDVDKEAEREREAVKQNFLEQSESRLSNISAHLQAWRENGVTEGILDSLRGEFQRLQESATRAGFDDVFRLSRVVVSLLEQGDKLVSDDSSLLNLLEEMHDGLAAEFGFISTTGEDHLRSLISMVQLLLAESETDENDRGEAVETHANQQVEGHSGQHELSAQIGPTSQALLVKVGRHRVALLLQTIERVMRVHENEMQLLNGQHYVALGEQQVAVIDLAERLGETCVRADAFRFLVLARSPDDLDADRVVAFAVDQLQEIVEIVIDTPGSQLASIVGVVGVTMLADECLALVLDPEQFVD